MNKYTLIFLNCILNEVKDCLGGCVFIIKYDLVFKIKPLESQINHSSTFKIVHNLFASTVNYMRYLIRYNKFLVLYSNQ